MVDFSLGQVPESLPKTPELSPQEGTTVADGKTHEQLPESKERFLEQPELKESAPTTQVKKIERTFPVASKKPVVAKATDEVAQRVEKILEEGMGELYQGLPADKKVLFKQKGEEAAVQISEMARTFKVHFSKLIRVIRDWLMTIPKINKFFLEQEAKIKADAIIEYIEARKEEQQKKP